jgi:hypothetical protein
MGARILQRDFGGMLPRVPATRLADTMAAEVIDADLSRGTVRPWREDLRLMDAVPGTGALFFENCCIVQAPCGATMEWVTAGCDTVYAAGIAGHPYPVQASPEGACAGDWLRLGLPCPPDILDVEWVTKTRTEHRATARAFMFTWVNSIGQESVASRPTSVFAQDFDNKVILSGWSAPPAEYGVTHVKLYELRAGVANANADAGAGTAAFFHVLTVPITAVAATVDPVRVTLGNVYDADLHQAPPAELRDVNHWDSTQLAGISGRYIRFSENRRWHAWPDKYRIETSAPPIRFIACGQYGYVLTCEAPEVIDVTADCSTSGARTVKRLDVAMPLVGRQALTKWGAGVAYASTNGLALLRGTSVRLYTEDIWTTDQWQAMRPDTMVMAIHNGYLFCASVNTCFRLKLPSDAFTPPDRYDLTHLSIRPTALYVTRDGRMIFADAAGVWLWAAGAGVKPYTYRSREFVTADRRGWSVLKVLASIGAPDIEVRTEERLIYRGGVPLNRPMRLPKAGRGTRTQFVLRGTAEITEVHLASSLEMMAHE